jgi:paraquat-inducible protein A
MTIACPECGTLEDIPRLARGSKAICVTCDTDLELTSGRSLVAAFACSTATCLLLFPTNWLPLLRVDLYGRHASNILAGGPLMIWQQGWPFLAAVSALFVVVLPFIRFGLLAVVLGSIRLGRHPGWLGPAFRWTKWIDPWAMLDVFLLAAFIGYYRLFHVNAAHLSIEPGGWCFIAAGLLTMLSRATLDERSVWRAIGAEQEVPPGEEVLACTTCNRLHAADAGPRVCSRCGATLHRRIPFAMSYTAALTAAAFVLFFPANVYPMDISEQFGRPTSYTIFDGIEALFRHGLWPLGSIIFCTSILVPAGKIVAIAWCIGSVRRRSRRHLVTKTKLFRAVAELGRWSKADPFTMVFFVPLMNFGVFGSAQAGWGATAFMLMSVLTMIASYTFDPRLMWDQAEPRARGRA